MSIEIELNAGVAIVHCAGVLKVGDAKEGATALWKEPGWAGESVVWDFRQSRFDVTSSDVREIADFILENQPSVPPSKVAFVTASDADYGMGRVFDVYRTDARTDFRVLRDYDEAVRWTLESELDTRHRA